MDPKVIVNDQLHLLDEESEVVQVTLSKMNS